MKKICRFLVLAFILCTYIPVQVNGTSGRLKSSSITICNGQTYGQHGDGHWHIAVKRGNYWYPSGSAIGSNPCNSITTYAPVVIPKSNNTSLKEVRVNEQTIDISDNMYYPTKESKVSINAKASDNNAKVEILESNSNLITGDNIFTIKVTAEDASVKEYKLNIYKLSSNTKATIKYNGEEIGFNNYNGKTIKVKESEIKLEVIPEDDKATSDVKDIYNLKVGSNVFDVMVKAEDDTTQKYVLNFYRQSDNVKATIKYNKKKIKFTNYKSNKITVKKRKIKLNVILDDSKAKSNVKKSYKLKNGNNKITITVKAENGKKQKYIINVYKKKGLFNL